MIGAFIGDIVGSSYEFHNVKHKDFDLFTTRTRITDDSVMTASVMDTLLECYPLDYSNLAKYKETLVKNMIKWYHIFPRAGYGKMFWAWLNGSNNYRPYNSFGNGSAMRISPISYAANSEEEVKLLARATSEVSHNHPEGIKGAEIVALAIYFARIGKTKQFIRDYIIKNYYPELEHLDYIDLKRNYSFDSTCQGSIPQALYCFIVSYDFMDTLRTSISIGGDSDTIAAISCSIAEAYYKDIDQELIDKVRSYFNDELNNLVDKFNTKFEK